MKTGIKIIWFAVSFTVFFYLLVTFGHFIGYNTSVLVADLGGLGWLYSAVAVIFAFFAAFALLLELERWQNLIDAVKDEVNALNELWLWSQYLPANLKTGFQRDIKEYLKRIIDGGWERGEGVQKDIGTETILRSLHSTVNKMIKEKPGLMPSVFSSLSDLIKHREERSDHLSFHMPSALKYTIIFNATILVLFSLFIGVYNVYLQYAVVICIAILVFVIYMLIEDLDNPIVFGDWHMTTQDYQDLLNRIESETKTDS